MKISLRQTFFFTLLGLFAVLSACITEDEINPSTSFIDVVWKYSSDGAEGSYHFKKNGKYTSTYLGVSTDGDWSWVDEDELIMKVNEIEFDGETYITYFRFERDNKTGEYDLYKLELKEGETPDINSDWKFDVTLSK